MRKALANFSVVIAMTILTIVNLIVGLEGVPTLNVPINFEVRTCGCVTFKRHAHVSADVRASAQLADRCHQ